jgi:diguanylate cyclase (GGDEF)-like protein/PAS domain S-box-containing protein
VGAPEVTGDQWTALARDSGRTAEPALSGTLIIDQTGKVTLASDASEAILGYASGTLVGKNVAIFGSAEITAALTALHDLPADSEPDGVWEYGGTSTLLGGDGHRIAVDLFLQRLRTAHGGLLLASLRALGIPADAAQRLHAPRFAAPVSHVLAADETPGEGVWRWNALSHEVSVSDEVYGVFGLPVGEPLWFGKTLAGFDAADRSRIFVLLERAMTDGTPFCDEARIIRPDGSMREVVHGARAERAPDGSVVALNGFLRDVTERNTRQRERERLNTFAMLANQAGKIGLWELDVRTNVSVWDSNMYALYGIDDLTVVPTLEMWSATLHPDDRENAVPYDVTALASDVPVSREYRVIWKNGETHYIRSVVTAVRDDSGAPTRLVGTDWDVTEIRLLSEQLRGEKELLVGSEARYRALTEALPQLVWVIDSAARCEYVNWRWTDYTGLSLERTRSAGCARVIHVEDFAGINSKRAAHPPREFECEARLRRRDGSFRWHLLRSVPFHDATGDIGKWITTATDIEERKTAEKTLAQTVAKLEHIAHHDPLTNLANRTLLIDRLAQAIAQADRAHAGVIVLYIDLDRFKAINDTLGHAAGDCVLRATAARIEGLLRVGDTASRVGGDEFIIVCATAGHGEDATHLASRLLEALTVPIDINGEPLAVEASIGISVYPSDGLDPDTLIRKADVAMYSAKGQGRNTVRRYNTEAHHSIVAAAQFEAELRHGMTAGEFIVHYQPIIDLRACRPLGAEALVRWEHPTRGLLLPAEFIGFAEERGLVAQVGEVVLDAACATLARLDASGFPDMMISVNVSAHQVGKPGFVESIVTALRRHAVDPGRLEIEITESVVMGNSQKTIAVLDEVRALGVTLSIDDFGTGYSSLAYIKRFPINTLKIDRSFVRDVADDTTDQAIAKTIITLAHSLKMNVIAEGVETRSQLAALRSFGVDCVQGYLFSRPLATADFLPFIESFPGKLLGLRPSRRSALRAAGAGIAPHRAGRRR